MTNHEEKIYEDSRILVIEYLTKISKIEGISNNNLISIVDSTLTYLFKDKFTDRELAQEIYNFQYRQLSDFDTAIYELLYKASEDNILKMHISFPKHTQAFKQYGRENINILKSIIETSKWES